VNLDDISILVKKVKGDSFANIENEDAEAEAKKFKEDNLTKDKNKSAEHNPDDDYQEDLTDAPINYTDIAEAIVQLSMNSRPGPDEIPEILLKKLKMIVSLVLYNIFHESLEKGEIPEILKHCFICPILKPESQREKRASWRLISLTSHVMKTLKRVTAIANLFVDDAKLKDVINNEEDVDLFQENLEKLNKWQSDNNMKFKGSKFQLLRYGPNENLKKDTVYFTPNMENVI
jgi:hypothetical protein